MFISSIVVFLFSSRTKSITDPVEVGTLMAIPSNFPSRFGQTLPIALAAPVDAGTIFCAQALPRRAFIPFLCATSNVAWSFV